MPKVETILRRSLMMKDGVYVVVVVAAVVVVVVVGSGGLCLCDEASSGPIIVSRPPPSDLLYPHTHKITISLMLYGGGAVFFEVAAKFFSHCTITHVCGVGSISMGKHEARKLGESVLKEEITWAREGGKFPHHHHPHPHPHPSRISGGMSLEGRSTLENNFR
ncbi:hypothetical protein QBC43DRAFT_89705 [Cladorrhinum sp. PSN259]|nr:hypothetical protein QBC43DRAFT_89705 [Cladorrhinum sp. PSN259]